MKSRQLLPLSPSVFSVKRLATQPINVGHSGQDGKPNGKMQKMPNSALNASSQPKRTIAAKHPDANSVTDKATTGHSAEKQTTDGASKSHPTGLLPDGKMVALTPKSLEPQKMVRRDQH